MLDLGLSLPDLAARGEARPVLVAPPAGFALTPAFNIYRGAGDVFSTDFNAAALKPAYQATIYVSLAGNNNNDGLSAGAPVRSIRLAINLGNEICAANGYAGFRLAIAAGLYKLSNTQARAGQPTQNGTWPDAIATTSSMPQYDCVIETTGGTVKNVSDAVMPAYAASGFSNIYVSTYTSQNPLRAPIDLAHLNPKGRPLAPREVTSVADVDNPSAELNAMAALHGQGVAYLDTVNKRHWVRLSDDRAPDSNMITLSGGLAMNLSGAAGRTLWAENMEFWSDAPFSAQTASGVSTLVFVDCGFCYGSGNGFS